MAILRASCECADGFLKESNAIGISNIPESKIQTMVILHASAFLLNKTVSDDYITPVNRYFHDLLTKEFTSCNYSDKFIQSILKAHDGILCNMIIQDINLEDDDNSVPSDFDSNPIYSESKKLLLHILGKEPDLEQIFNVSTFIVEWLPVLIKYMSRFSISDGANLPPAPAV